MKKVITYGTYDLLHFGHIRLLERAKALGDYLIVGVTADDYDKTRGKINVQQSLMERMAAVQATGLADEIIVEEYEGQKIDDIIRLGVDIFAIGSDWIGKFDYLNEYCKVVYLERTKGVSSSELRSLAHDITIGVVGQGSVADKFVAECSYINGVKCIRESGSYKELIDCVDAVYIYSHPSKHFDQVLLALNKKKHVLCEMPLTMDPERDKELFDIAQKNKCILALGCKTAYSTAYNRMLLLAKSGKIGEIVSVDATCTSLVDEAFMDECSLNHNEYWGSLMDWGPIALLPVLQLLGTEYKKNEFFTVKDDDLSGEGKLVDKFTKCSLLYSNSCASIKVGNGVKSEGELIVTGTKGYIWVPAPWWKTDYFEIRYEDPKDNKRYFYQLEGEGIRYEIASFVKAIQNQYSTMVGMNICYGVSAILNDLYVKQNFNKIKINNK